MSGSQGCVSVCEILAEEVPYDGGRIHVLLSPRVFAALDFVEPYLDTVIAAEVSVQEDTLTIRCLFVTIYSENIPK